MAAFGVNIVCIYLFSLPGIIGGSMVAAVLANALQAFRGRPFEASLDKLLHLQHGEIYDGRLPSPFIEREKQESAEKDKDREYEENARLPILKTHDFSLSVIFKMLLPFAFLLGIRQYFFKRRSCPPAHGRIVHLDGEVPP